MDITVERILLLLKENHVEQKDLAEHLGISKQAITDWKTGKTKSYQKCIDKIAAFFNVSVDFLLGRTDSPTATYSIHGNNNVQVNGNNGDHSPLTVNSSDNDDTTAELVELVQSLPLVKRAEAIIYLNGLKKRSEE